MYACQNENVNEYVFVIFESRIYSYVFVRTRTLGKPDSIYLPTQLSKKWASHRGDDIPRTRYQYYVTGAVQSTPGHISKCWNAAQETMTKKYFLDVFQRFFDADFTKKKGDNRERKLVFVLRVLEENDKLSPQR